MPAARKYHSYCYTINNYDESDLQRLRALHPDKVSFLLAGREVAPVTGTPHLQGYLWTVLPCTLQQVQRLLGGSAWAGVPGPDKPPTHWLEYCTKEDTDALQLGTIPEDQAHRDDVPLPGQRGKRNDLLDAKHAIDSGSSVQDLMDKDATFAVVAKYRAFLEHYASHKRRRTVFCAPTVTVYYGTTGCGKTRRAYEEAEDPYVWGPSQGSWFDGYQGQTDVILDEFRGQLPFGCLLQLLDGYPGVKVQVKGGMALWCAKRVWITSPTGPREWYPNLAADDRIDQLTRRLSAVTNLTPLPPSC